MKIAIVGIGYVGLSLACLLSGQNNVTAVDIDAEKIEKLRRGVSPIADREIEAYLSAKPSRLSATTDGDAAYRTADYVIVSTPTNYDESANTFDTSSVEDVIRRVLSVNENAVTVIKSTVPVGFTERMKAGYENAHLLFCPEFLREGRALYDNLYPGRIIVGIPRAEESLRSRAETFAGLLRNAALKSDVPVLIMNSTEAEAVKLFANTYLAMRVSFFNELDTYADANGLDVKSIIQGVGLDPRIGSHYNNPSFGYGGYCLPKDTKQLLADFAGIPQNMISATVEANNTRKAYVAGRILERHPKTVGIYRLTMKSGSDNFRQAAIRDVITLLAEAGVGLVIYEPSWREETFDGMSVQNDLEAFKKVSDVIIANRCSDELSDVREKVYTRDVFSRD